MKRRGWRAWSTGAAVAPRVAMALVATVALSATPASAAEPSAEERARLATLLREGAAAAKAKKWDACIDAYARAAALQEDATTLGELGVCEEAAGRYADAHGHLRRARAALGPATERGKVFQAAFGRAAEHVAVVFVTVQPSHARLVVDGRPLGPGDGLGVAMAPGRHTISAHLEGYESATQTRVVNARDMPNVDLVLKPKAAPKGASTSPAAAPPRPVPDSTRAPAPFTPWYAPNWSARGVFVGLTYAAGATLIVSGATAIGFEIDRAAIQSTVPDSTSPGFEGADGACHRIQPSRPNACAALDERMQQRDAARAVVIGAAITTGVTAGLAALFTGLERARSRPSIVPSVSTNGGGIVIVGAW